MLHTSPETTEFRADLQFVRHRRILGLETMRVVVAPMAKRIGQVGQERRIAIKILSIG